MEPSLSSACAGLLPARVPPAYIGRRFVTGSATGAVGSDTAVRHRIGAFVSVEALVADVLRGDADPPPRSGRRGPTRAADAPAEAVRDQWAAEARLRRLQDPVPLDVR
ncbi:hypothetical protein [Streptomyces sp. NPDC005209]|uniref:hypothetical protein n=1 Tax=Streptomyces sp. NPDC005209 TaxID=3156715 RepID=UPI0033B53EC0